MALQAENYALEKQLHSYQQSIARNNTLKTRDEGDGGSYPDTPLDYTNSY